MAVIMNKTAWNILSPDEQMAITLQLGMDKSSWESGEILGKSHYKYLEIKYRGAQFLKMFTEHLDLFDDIIPSYVKGDKYVIEYLNQCIKFRKKPLDAINTISALYGKILKPEMNDRIIKQLKEWDKEDNAYSKTVLNLAKEFDRWNNFRILPKTIQEPSAFKRRVKNSYKKQIRTVCGIHVLAIEQIRKLYEVKNTNHCIYLPLISEGKPLLLRLKHNQGSMNIVNTIGLYVFLKKEDANEYLTSLYHYLAKGKKECIDGLQFWPSYRLLIQKSFNYETVMQISSSRKYLQYALAKLEFI